MRIFRFFPKEAKDFFFEGKLWFSGVRDFNDPFELYPRYDRFIEANLGEAQKKAYAFLDPSISVDWNAYRKQSELNAEKIFREGLVEYPEKFIQQLDSKYKIVCFTENYLSLLMWAHYASGHQGFVVEFDVAAALFSPTYFGKVIYDAERPDISNLPVPQVLLLTKSKEWEYESEHRLVMPVRLLNLGRRSDGREKYFVELSTESVVGVYFGCRIEPLVKESILSGLNCERWRGVKTFSMLRDHTNFALTETPN